MWVPKVEGGAWIGGGDSAHRGEIAEGEKNGGGGRGRGRAPADQRAAGVHSAEVEDAKDNAAAQSV